MNTANPSSYAYDGEGRRVKRVVGPSSSALTTIYVYNAMGQLVAEYPSTAPETRGGTSYLTEDHLGSTRLVTNRSGAVVSRVDYLPFGEEIGAGVGARATAQSYNAASTLKQKFTGKERDDETGLDYFGARYYYSAQGCFTSTDPLLASATIYNPQTWNRYTYTLNNPLRYIDPLGLYVFSAELGGNQEDSELIVGATSKKDLKRVLKIIYQRQKIRDALERARYSANDRSLTPEQQASVQRAVNSYGKFNDGVHDNVIVGFVGNKNASSSMDGKNSDGNIYVNLNFSRSERDPAITIAHEGSHVADFQDWLANRGAPNETAYDISQYETETRAFMVSSYVAQGLGLSRYYPGADRCSEVWNKGWTEQQREAFRVVGVGMHIWKNYESMENRAPLAPKNPGYTLSTSP